MADKWIATSMIRYLPDDAESRRELVIFQPGDEVKDVPKVHMDRLIELGSVVRKSELERREAPEGESDLEKEYQAKLDDKDAEIASLKAKLADAEKARNTPQGSTTAAPTTPRK